MTVSDSLGRCPRCDEPIRPGRLLIEYESENKTRLYAECFRCEGVVRPR